LNIDNTRFVHQFAEKYQAGRNLIGIASTQIPNNEHAEKIATRSQYVPTGKRVGTYYVGIWILFHSYYSELLNIIIITLLNRF
jgi:hypothetical protein